MNNIHRLKRSFTSGELSPFLDGRVDLDKYNAGLSELLNAYCMPQGPVRNRPGFKFVYDLDNLGFDWTNPKIKMVPFVASEIAAYVLVFFNAVDVIQDQVVQSIKVVFLSDKGGLITYPDPPPTECPAGTLIDPPVNAGDIVVLKMLSGFSKDLDFDYAQSGDSLFIAQKDQQPTVIKRFSNTCWTHETITFTDQPSEWQTDNWPRLVTLHQQRLVYASSTIDKQKVWMSKAGDLFNFGTSSPLQADDAISFSLASGNQNRIQWVASSKALLIGTLGGEWTVTGGTGGVISAASSVPVLAQKQTNNGGEKIKPLLIGYTTLFIERHAKTINEFVYDYTYDSYRNTDLTILSNHLTMHNRITDWTYQQTPNGIVWCIRDDGKLIGLTYQRQHKVVGFHEHDTDGLFKAVCAIPAEDTREDKLFAAIYRTIDGKDKMYLEVMAQEFKFDDASNGRFMDSYIETAPTTTSGTTVSGLAHLEGKTVSVLADGTVHPPQTVTNGYITLNKPYTDVVVGLPYETIITPLLADIPSNTGTMLGRKQRITDIEIKFYKSLGGYIMRIDDEDREYIEEEIIFRVPTDLTGNAVPLYSNIKRISFPEGWSREAKYSIRQKQPLPICLLYTIDIIKAYE